MYLPWGFGARNLAKTLTEWVTQQILLYRWKVPKGFRWEAGLVWDFGSAALPGLWGMEMSFLPIAVINRLS